MEECWRMARIRKTGKRSICKGEGQDRWSTLCFDWIKNNNSRSTSGGGWFGYPPTWRPCHTLWVALWNRIRHPQSIVTGDKDTRHISKYFAMAGPKQRELIFFIRPGIIVNLWRPGCPPQWKWVLCSWSMCAVNTNVSQLSKLNVLLSNFLSL